MVATDDIEAARKQFAWLAFAAAVIAAAGMLLPVVRDQAGLGPAAMVTIPTAVLLFTAPIAAVIGGQLVLRFVLSSVGLVLGASVATLILHQGPLQAVTAAWALAVTLILALAVVRSPLRAWQTGAWE